MAKKVKGNRVQVILECTEHKESGMPGTSRYITTKNSDLIFTGTPVGVGPVHIGEHLQGYLEDKNVLDFHIR